MKKIITLLLFTIAVLKTEAQSSVFTMVDELLLKGDYQLAIQLLDKQEPKTIEILDKTATIYQTVGNYTEAIKNYSEALKLEDNDRIKVKLGNAYNSAGLSNKAVETFEGIIQNDSTNLLVINSLGKLYLGKNKSVKAEKIYTFLKTQDSLNPEYPYKLAQSLEKQRKYFRMCDSYLDAYSIDSLHLKSIYGLAKFFKELREKDSTMLFIDKGLNIDSINVNFLQLKANELYFSKEFKNAIVYLKKLDSLQFKSLNTLEMFGMCYSNLKELDSAEIYFKKALKIEQNDPKILYRLASLYYDKENFKLAKIYLTRSIHSGKGDLDKQYYLSGIIAFEEKELKLALDNFEKAFKNNSKNYKALFELAMASDIYYKDQKIALKYFEIFIKRYKNKDKVMTLYANERIKEIKKAFFIEGEIIE